jgi:voltage-gated sodium channel
MTNKVLRLIQNKNFKNFIILLIIFNAFILGLETYDAVMDRYGKIILFIDSAILAIFVVEIALKIFAYRLKFFKRPWCLFDLFVVSIALIPATNSFAALRALRVLRVLRLISTISSMRKVIEGLLSAIPGIISVASIMTLFFYVFAVIGTHLYGENFPQWFGSLGESMYTLFQIMTLESWSMGIVRPVMEQHPTAWAFFITYIMVTTFTMLNLFIAIIVNALHSDTDESAEQSRVELKSTLIKELKDMESRLNKKIDKSK